MAPLRVTYLLLLSLLLTVLTKWLKAWFHFFKLVEFSNMVGSPLDQLSTRGEKINNKVQKHVLTPNKVNSDKLFFNIWMWGQLQLCQICFYFRNVENHIQFIYISEFINSPSLGYFCRNILCLNSLNCSLWTTCIKKILDFPLLWWVEMSLY